MKYLLAGLQLLFYLNCFGQTNSPDSIISQLIDLGDVNNHQNFDELSALKKQLEGVEIIMLGEESHGDKTTYETKIKLIKYLFEELGFSILAFESGIYDCSKAWEKVKAGKSTKLSLASSVTYIWSTTKEFQPLTAYIDLHKNDSVPLQIAGFDNQLTGPIGNKELIQDLKQFLTQNASDLVVSSNWNHFERSMQLVSHSTFNKYKKSAAIQDTIFINSLMNGIPKDAPKYSYWNQVLTSLKYFISDCVLKTNFRDYQMAQNLIWLKEKYPNQKIICWGATSHFLHHSTEIRLKGIPYSFSNGYYKKTPQMGTYIKNKYGSKAYMVGFTAYEGTAGFSSYKKIQPPKTNSLEYLIGTSNYTNCLLPLNDLSLSPYISRPLSYVYMKNDISNVLDALIFNRYMTPPKADINLLIEIFPENKWLIKYQ